MTTPSVQSSTQRSERVESAVQIGILMLIGTMAGAASFTHVHDWTMDNAPAGTGDWFGWANAVISELTPTAAGLEIRRRKRRHQPITYPMCVLIGAATLSLAAQVAEAKPGLTGWLLSAVPALAFLALSKLVLARTNGQHTDQIADTDQTGDIGKRHTDTDNGGTTTATTTGTTEPAATAAISSEPAHHHGELPEQLLTSARMAAFAYQRDNGHPITAPGLADYLGIQHNLAEQLHAAIGEPTPARTAVTTAHANGVPYTGDTTPGTSRGTA